MLVLAATPIGRVADAPPRLAEELAGADVVAAEDTRRLERLTQPTSASTLAGRVVSYFEGNESARTPACSRRCVAGERVLLVTDAGMPSVSDPGYRLVAAAVEAGRPGHRRARPVGGADRAGRLRAAGGPVLLRGLPAPQGRASGPAGWPRWPPSSARWSSSRRRTAPRPRWPRWPTAFGDDRPGRGLPRADQDPRGGTPRARWPSSPPGPRTASAARSRVVVQGAAGSRRIAADPAAAGGPGRRARGRRDDAARRRSSSVARARRRAQARGLRRGPQAARVTQERAVASPPAAARPPRRSRQRRNRSARRPPSRCRTRSSTTTATSTSPTPARATTGSPPRTRSRPRPRSA